MTICIVEDLDTAPVASFEAEGAPQPGDMVILRWPSGSKEYLVIGNSRWTVQMVGRQDRLSAVLVPVAPMPIFVPEKAE